ncbi:GntR family transcriptional regulator [Chelonobacter oris]|uniref:MocR-like pyridoxine biosynthesis transcription factor PdxR n=1 Tax=Chelonobacter oris TaxID=505317 RepID=UPI00244A0867|nr:PLP-dependent aminotransferase family protein [Chelonobacter oris]MDH3000017.1 GntR family transcriptional regulator [Chelonobacter oris]
MKNMTFQLDKQRREPLYVQLYRQIKQDITNGRLVYGEQLPSKRKIADYLTLSLNTVETAYGQLLAEGYIESRARKGFFVHFHAEQFFIQNQKNPVSPVTKTERHFRYDLNPHQVDTALFPFSRYKKAIKNSLNAANRHLLCLGETQGESVLREQIRQYLYASRGVSCSIEQIVLGAGVETCISQLILLLDQRYSGQCLQYAMEQYGYPVVEQLLTLFGKPLLKLPLFNQAFKSEPKMDLQLLAQSAVNILYLTPSHQYPYGNILSVNERHQLLEWVHRRDDRYIIEDDYDSEFRYKGKPIPSLQHLDSSLSTQSKVIYLGSFSKLLMPSLRVSFIVLPLSLLPRYQRTFGVLNSTVPRLTQHILAQFMQSGEFEKHIHKMRTNYRKKMERLCQLLQPYRHVIRHHGEHSGFYLLLDLYQEPRSAAQLQMLAEKCGIKLYPVKHHNPDKKYFSFGFGNLGHDELGEAVALLMNAWGYEGEAAA